MRVTAWMAGRIDVRPPASYRRRALAAACIAPLACGAALACAPAAAAAHSRRGASALASGGGSDASFERDCGFSDAIASGEALWLFCDTQVYKANGEPGAFIPGATAAEGPYVEGEAPSALSEVPTPPEPISLYPYDGTPQQFLPAPEDVYDAGGGPCSGTGRYAASWPSGLTTIPGGSTLLIVYDEVCVDGGFPSVEGLAMREYDPAANTLSSPYELFKPSPSGATLPASEQLGSPIFSAGRLYMFSGTCSQRDELYGDCLSGAVYLMRTLAGPGAYTNPEGYEWASSSGWSRSSSSAASIIGGAKPEDPAAVTVNSYSGEGLVLITETNLGGGYQVWLAPSGDPSPGQWTAGPSAMELPGCSAGHGLDLCRALTGHPEASDSRAMLMSYFDPEANHLEVVGVPWQPSPEAPGDGGPSSLPPLPSRPTSAATLQEGVPAAAAPAPSLPSISPSAPPGQLAAPARGLFSCRTRSAPCPRAHRPAGRLARHPRARRPRPHARRRRRSWHRRDRARS